MRIRVRLFAIQRELAGTREVGLDLPTGATIEDAWLVLVGRHPTLGPGRRSVRFARNGEYADADTALADGDELACIPPVSGGSAHRRAEDDSGSAGLDPGHGEPLRILELREAPFPAGLAAELAARLSRPADGGVVMFIGRTRISPGTPSPGQEGEAARFAGQSVTGLAYEAHEPMALAVLDAIADEVGQRFGVVRLAIVHRTGEVPLGEPSVIVVAASAHRDAAFAAARYAIDETKARAPIWKAERFADGHVWIGQPARAGPDEPETSLGAADRRAGGGSA